ncbi:MAG: hypothetical protein ACFN9G_07780 [Cardiobacterium sp.]|jgi:hypothetical protein
MKTLLKTLLLTALAAISSLAWSAEQTPEAVAKAFFAEFIHGDAAKAAQYVYIPQDSKSKPADEKKAMTERVKAEQAQMKAIGAEVTLGKVTYINKEKTQATIKGTLKSKASDKPQDADIPLIKTKDGWKVVMPS